MPNRTDNAIKNRFWSRKRALQRKAKKEKSIADSRKVDDMPDLHDLPDFKVEETKSMSMDQPSQHPANYQNNKRQKRDVVTIYDDMFRPLASANGTFFVFFLCLPVLSSLAIKDRSTSPGQIGSS